jgi:hypothetical protein
MSTLTPDTDPPPFAAPRIATEDILDIRVQEPAVPALLWAALGAGVLLDLAVRSGVASIGGALLVIGVSVAMFKTGRLRTLEARVLVATAPLFGGWLAVRTSDWLLPLDAVAVLGLFVLGASLSSGGSLFDLTLPAVVQRAGVAVLHGSSVPSFLQPLLRREVDRAARHGVVVPAVRGVLLAVPILLVLGSLLASADAVFASIFQIDLHGSDLLLHLLLVGFGAWCFLGLLRTASAERVGPRAPLTARLGRTELTVVLTSVVGLFGAFAGSQLIALSSGGRRVLDTSGLTYAEYARSGFFQLLWVAALTVALLLGLRAVVGEDGRNRRRFTVLAEVVVVLTLVIVVVAVRRLNLYQDAFGLTMLRLYGTIFALWVGAVILALGATIAGVRSDRSWLPGAAVVAGLVLLFGLNIANPEAIVVRHNLDRMADGRDVDSEYLTEGLSLDAVPTIVELLPTFDDATRTDLLERIGCPPPSDGWAGWNRSRAAAVAALGDDCIPAPDRDG